MLVQSITNLTVDLTESPMSPREKYMLCNVEFVELYDE